MDDATRELYRRLHALVQSYMADEGVPSMKINPPSTPSAMDAATSAANDTERVRVCQPPVPLLAD